MGEGDGNVNRIPESWESQGDVVCAVTGGSILLVFVYHIQHEEDHRRLGKRQEQRQQIMG